VGDERVSAGFDIATDILSSICSIEHVHEFNAFVMQVRGPFDDFVAIFFKTSAAIRNTLSIGGCGLTTPSSTRIPIVSLFVRVSSYMLVRQPMGTQRLSLVHGSLQMMSLMTLWMEASVHAKGPIDEGTCSCPSVETGTP
jgi:hypothetical protein